MWWFLCRPLWVEGKIVSTPLCHERSVQAYASLTSPADAANALTILAASRVAVVGCGGLGGYVTDLLARAGIGMLRLVDGDVFSESNLNRQLLCTHDTLGQSKVEVARKHVLRINPAASVECHPFFATAETFPALVQSMNLVVDALDSIPHRRALCDAASACGVPVVHGAIAGFLGHATTIFPHESTLDRLYPPLETAPLQDETGVAPPLPALIASVQVAEVLKYLLGQHTSMLRGTLFLCDLGAPYCGIVPLAKQTVE